MLLQGGAGGRSANSRRRLSAKELVASARTIADSLGAADSAVVGPANSRKPFRGRVVRADALILPALDFIFYSKMKLGRTLSLQTESSAGSEEMSL
jgi:hypothetical protein